MRSIARAAALVVLVAMMPAAGAAELSCGSGAPVDISVRLDYAVTASKGPLSLAGDGAVVFRRVGGRYRMTSSLRTLGLFDARQSSEGTIGSDGLVPDAFAHHAGNRPALAVTFDWAAKQVTFRPAGTVEPARPGMQDRLSLLVQLAWLRRSQPLAGEFEMPVASHRRVFAYTFVARGDETLDLPAGRFETVRLERRPESGDDVLDVWLAPQLCSLPVRVRYRDDKGLIVDQRLRGVQVLSP